MQLHLLAEIPDALDIIAQWYYDEWASVFDTKSLDDVKQGLKTYLNTDCMPLIVVAVVDGEIAGAAQLKYHEMDMFPDYEHWLGGVYVADGYRGKGMAEKIILRILEKARDFKVETIYLQTENLTGGLYARMGWEAIEQVHSKGSDVVVMKKSLI
ncbi:MAG: GNAT family N-acetyltransferase [Calditrichia bacterium]